MGKAATKPRISHSDNRREAVLEAAARRFAAQGFEGVSMRDIAGDAGMLAGSLYYHFPSKEALAEATHGEGVRRIVAAVQAAIAGETEPWRRLELACIAHLQELLAGSDYAGVVTQAFAQAGPALRRRLIPQRDIYERLFASLVDALPLRVGADHRLLRLQLLGALNWAPTWYRAGGLSPQAIAKCLVATIRDGAAG